MPRPIDNKEFAIGILSTTAVILAVALVVIGTRPEPVRADGMTTGSGPYVLTTGGVSLADEEYLYVLHTPSQKIIAYRFDATRRQIGMVSGLDLAEVAQNQADQSQQKPRGRRRP